MKTKFTKTRKAAMVSITVLSMLSSACEEDKTYILEQKDIRIEMPSEGLKAKVGQAFQINVSSISDEGVAYHWFLDGEPISVEKELEHTIWIAGVYELKLQAKQDDREFSWPFEITVDFDEATPPAEGATAYITQILDFMPAIGQFTNALPRYEPGDTQEDMNRKVLDAIGNNESGMISLGGFGGYVVAGFDHTIQNVPGKRDFRILANAFYSAANPDTQAPEGGSCEPGVIMVAYDVNANGKPDENEWYEIAGSAHEDPAKELWYQKAVDNGNDVKTYPNYEITYYRPEQEPTTPEEMATYIRWEDNQGHSGYKAKNVFHNQCYFPLWTDKDKITFRGTCLPQNGVDESGQGNYYVLYKFRYGYADNEINAKDESAIDISWAVNGKGQKVNLPGADFIKIYTGVNQENGWLGECSTEIAGIEDLHILGQEIDTRR